MAWHRRLLSLLRALGKVAARHARSFGSVGGQNLSVFIGLFFLAQSPQSAAFFLVVLVAVILIPMSADPMQALPEDRRLLWPFQAWEWTAIRMVSLFFSPGIWIGIAIGALLGWQVGALAIGGGAVVQLLMNSFPGVSSGWLRWVPAPPGATGAIMRLQWRGMLRTLDPYVALAFSAATTAFRFSGQPLDSEAPRIMSLIVALALSTHTQVLLGIDGYGAERYSLLPLRGWRILLAKDLAFLAVLAILVAPLDLRAGLMGGLASLVTGHHVSVMMPRPQAAWRFTAGALVPWGIVQTALLFAVGTAGWPVAVVCILAWIGSVALYGWVWDRDQS